MSALAPALVVVPVAGCLSLLVGAVRPRAALVMIATGLALALLATIELLAPEHAVTLGGAVRLDATARLFLAVVNPVYLGVAVYVRGRAAAAPALTPELWRFVAASLAFVAACNVTLVANHLQLQWLALEASTLAAAGMISHGGGATARQAAFRYVLFSSVGLGLALLGLSCLERAGGSGAMLLDRLAEAAPTQAGPWQSLGLFLLLLGLGTKLGLAPMYAWLPETYGAAPAAASALLGAVQFNCALVMLLRVVAAYRPAAPALISSTLVALGILSMVVSTVNVIATRSVRRLVAYASINHAGVIAIGLGVGRAAAYGLLLYVLSNAFTKAILFVTAGNVRAHYGTDDTREISGLIKTLPYSGVFLMVGTFALLGFPPFGSFVGELLILSALVSSGRVLVFAVFCALITMTFVAVGRTIFPMIWGEGKGDVGGRRQTLAAAWPKMMFLVALVVLGVYVPSSVGALIADVAASIAREGTR